MSIILVLLSGFLLACMESFNGVLSSSIGLYMTSFLAHFIGLILLGFYVRFILKQKISLLHAPLYVYTSGILGMMLVVFTSLAVSQIGAVLTVSFSLAGQLLLSIIMDHYGMLGIQQVQFNTQRLPALALIVLGLILVTIN